MKELQRENQNVNENCGRKECIVKEEQHRAHLLDSRHFFDFLNNLKGENPWDEKDFDLVFMYL